jgi:hypothetical protein
MTTPEERAWDIWKKIMAPFPDPNAEPVAIIASAIREARNETAKEAADMAKKYLLFVFEAHPEINVLANDLHASILALKDKPEGVT